MMISKKIMMNMMISKNMMNLKSDCHIMTDCWVKDDINGHNNDSSDYGKVFIDDAEAHKVPVNCEN